MKYYSVDEVLRDAQVLLEKAGEKQEERYELSSPILFGVDNSMARFSCAPVMKEFTARAAAGSLYLLSGMNGNDFI